MKKGQYWILMAVLWICFLAAVIRILFILNPDMGQNLFRRPAAVEEETENRGESDADEVENDPGTREQKKDDADREKGAGVKGGAGVKDDADRKDDADGKGGIDNTGGAGEKDGRDSMDEKGGGNGAAKSNRAAGGFGAVIRLPEEGADKTASESDARRLPPRIVIASDLHYQSAETTDYGKAFQRFVKDGDGKVNAYLPQLLDALIDELIDEKPDAFLLTGDITINGEKINHLELAKKLKRLTEAGVQVLVIPGNHDINNYRGRLYFGDEELETESVSLEEFTEIYNEFGWDQAISRDEASFSYVYPLRESIWLMLLDTAQYDPLNIVDGAVRQETISWMKENLEQARAAGIQVIVSGHHNLLQESRMFTTMCVLENSSQVVELLEEYQIPLYISGHLHLQRIQKHRREPGAEEYGIYEIVSDAVSIPPCQYGALSWDDRGFLVYETRQTDVSAWARKSGQLDENLLDFEQYETRYVRELIRDQILEKTAAVPETAAEGMAELYAELYADYCAGVPIDRQGAERSDGYRSWARYLPDSAAFREIKSMLKDSLQDNNYFIMPGEISQMMDGGH